MDNKIFKWIKLTRNMIFCRANIYINGFLELFEGYLEEGGEKEF